MIPNSFHETPEDFFKRTQELKKLKEIAAKKRKELHSFAKARKKRKNKK